MTSFSLLVFVAAQNIENGKMSPRPIPVTSYYGQQLSKVNNK